MFKFKSISKPGALSEIYQNFSGLIKILTIFTIIALLPISLLVEAFGWIFFRIGLVSCIVIDMLEEDCEEFTYFVIFSTMLIGTPVAIASYGETIYHNISTFKNPMYIVYDPFGKPSELREYIYPNEYSYEYCYYATTFIPDYNEECVFTKSSRYKLIAQQHTVMKYYDSTGKVQYKKFSEMNPDDIIKGWSKPIPKKPLQTEQKNFK